MNIKRFLSGALCAVLLLALCPAAAADAPCEISSAEELSLLRETPDGDFVLTADIDMTGVDWRRSPFPHPRRRRTYHLQSHGHLARRRPRRDGGRERQDLRHRAHGLFLRAQRRFGPRSFAARREHRRGDARRMCSPERSRALLRMKRCSKTSPFLMPASISRRHASANRSMSTTAASPVSVGSSASAAERIRTAPRIPHSFSPMRALRRSAARSFSAAFSPAATRRSPLHRRD